MFKRFLTSFVIALTAVSAFAQTPYDAFAPEQSVKRMNMQEHKDYLLANSDTTAIVRYVAIDWNKSSYTLIGKDGINISTGLLSELDKKFLSMDQHCEDYYSTSPYAYCLGNPINYVDPNGKDVAVLNKNPDENIGHMAILIQNDEGKWVYYSVNGNNVYISGEFYGGRPEDDLDVGSWDSPEEFLKSSYNTSNGEKGKYDPSINGYGYVEAYIIPTTPDQDQIIRDTFVDVSNNETYTPLNVNCATTVERSLKAAGIKVAVPEILTKKVPSNFKYGISGYNYTVPNLIVMPTPAFNSIKANNPQGRYVRNR